MSDEYIDEHVMIPRAELMEILMKAKGIDPETHELIHLDIRSTQYQRIFPLWMGKWSDIACPFDLFTFGVKKKDDT